MVKVGDRVIVVGNEAMFGSSKEERNGVGVVSDLLDDKGYYGVTLDTGYYVAAKPENIHYYAEATVYTTPPQKITQNGYEYSLVGPVKPDWLVDGAWVVDKETGRKYRVSCDNGVYTFNNGAREVIIDFISLPTRFRPHTASDWKWGDWALYEGKRVFVLSGLENASSMIAVTFPNIDSGGWGEWDKNHDFIDVSKLTPIF